MRFNSFREGSSFSSPGISSSRNLPRKSFSHVESSDIHYKINFKSPLPEYEATSSSPRSPTPSDFQSVNTITQEFEINKDFLRKDFDSPQNSQNKSWFLSFKNEFKDQIREYWYADMKHHAINIPFFTWFSLYCQKRGIENPYKLSYIQVQSKLSQNWNMTDGRTITLVHPPPTSFKFDAGGKEPEAAPFKIGRCDKPRESIIIEDIIKVYQQNNFTNQILQTIANQTDHISTKLDYVKPIELTNSNQNQIPLSLPKFPNEVSSQPHIKPLDFPYSIIQKIESSSSSSKDINLKQNLSKISSKINVIQKNQIASDSNTESDDHIDQIENQFIENPQISKIRNPWKNNSTKNYYPRPTPPDIQYEERSKFQAHQYHPDTIHEWNIDGKSEYEILNTLQEMGMAMAAYKTRESNEQVVFAKLIPPGNLKIGGIITYLSKIN
ncbi:uncharacterized protein LOC141643517 isoform X1 [Silene latifolia]|uniref:uncharacterized protein LOC141643517 isoform X1 n=1 Tax=Silene latifolia TaxID=37657 RepID=UPI003D76B0AD